MRAAIKRFPMNLNICSNFFTAPMRGGDKTQGSQRSGKTMSTEHSANNMLIRLNWAGFISMMPLKEGQAGYINSKQKCKGVIFIIFMRASFAGLNFMND